MLEHIIKEVESVTGLLEARTAAGAAPSAPLQKSFADAIIKQIEKLRNVTSNDAMPLVNMLKDGRPYGKQMTSKILDALDTALSAQLARPSSDACKGGTANKSGQTAGQHLREVWHYQTQADWDLYRDKTKFMATKMIRMVERMQSVGLNTPHEQTLKWMLAVLLISHYDDMPKPRAIYEKLLDLKQTAAAAEKRPYALKRFNTYPAKPCELPDDVFALAYPPDGPQPISVELHGIYAVADKIPLRKSSKLLKDTNAMSSECFHQIKRETKKGLDETPTPIKAERLDTSTNEVQHASSALPPGKVLVVAPADAHEDRLLSTYKSEIWKHRACDQGMLAPAPSRLFKPALVAAKTEDGGLLLQPRCPSVKNELVEPEIKKEPYHEIKPPDDSESKFKSESQVHTGGDDADPDALDPYAKAAIAAFSARAAKKKDDIKERRATGGKKKRKGKGKTVMKVGGLKKKNIKTAAKSEYKTLTVATAAKSCPDGDSEPILYKGGIIYTSTKQSMFRALKVRGDKYTESSCGWGKKKSRQDAWTHVIKAIDAHKPAK